MMSRSPGSPTLEELAERNLAEFARASATIGHKRPRRGVMSSSSSGSVGRETFAPPAQSPLALISREEELARMGVLPPPPTPPREVSSSDSAEFDDVDPRVVELKERLFNLKAGFRRIGLLDSEPYRELHELEMNINKMRNKTMENVLRKYPNAIRLVMIQIKTLPDGSKRIIPLSSIPSKLVAIPNIKISGDNCIRQLMKILPIGFEPWMIYVREFGTLRDELKKKYYEYIKSLKPKYREYIDTCRTKYHQKNKIDRWTIEDRLVEEDINKYRAKLKDKLNVAHIYQRKLKKEKDNGNISEYKKQQYKNVNDYIFKLEHKINETTREIEAGGIV